MQFVIKTMKKFIAELISFGIQRREPSLGAIINP